MKERGSAVCPSSESCSTSMPGSGRIVRWAGASDEPKARIPGLQSGIGWRYPKRKGRRGTAEKSGTSSFFEFNGRRRPRAIEDRRSSALRRVKPKHQDKL